MSSVFDAGGIKQTQARVIAEVFVVFFESRCNGKSHSFQSDGICDRAATVAPEEVRRQLKTMRAGKAADENGLVVELLRKGSNLLMQMIADVFTAVLDPRATVPSYWKAS